MKKHWCPIDSSDYINRLRTRIFEKSKPGNNGCIEWFGSRAGAYGQIKVRNKNVLVHRAVVELSGVIIPIDCDVMHSCDNPRCINIDHLIICTHDQNMADKARKGRAPAKLTIAQVKTIKKQLSAGHSCNSIAVNLGVSPHTITDIKKGVTWAWITN